MSISGIQGQLLEVTVVACNKLKDTEWISRQDPYVCLEYASSKHRTRTCTDGGKNPTFQEKFVFTLIEGLREISVVVWNSNTLTFDDFIGTGKIQLQKVLSQGYDDSSWPLQDKRGRHAGEVRLIMHYPNAIKPAKTHVTSTQSAPTAPPFAGTPSSTHIPMYSTPPPSVAPYPPTSYPPPPNLYPSYPPNPSGHPPPPYHPPAYPYPPTSSYPPNTGYPPTSAYPPNTAYPPTSAYPPNTAHPPPPHDHSYYPRGGSLPTAPYPPPY
ncbi:Calcium-dependent lipid-binding (CaLB domain) family protein [Striga hermonthica]|uniref:Calcium-dependent lipid-binding (CaLB domain) family protein n=1 Tax=Striga hermonthica TaxID=68872 RepID=A0A9N7MI43_STRHE|nr:Calcium-dependent lipid-binding (CaLB domain) family protein [Striga hermonthica]